MRIAVRPALSIMPRGESGCEHQGYYRPLCLQRGAPTLIRFHPSECAKPMKTSLSSLWNRYVCNKRHTKHMFATGGVDIRGAPGVHLWHTRRTYADTKSHIG